MKKTLTRIFVLSLTVFALLLLLSACGSGGEEKHTHSFALASNSATCTEDGTAVYRCECGETYSAKVSALGHDDVTVYTAAATCTQEGAVCYQCSRCGLESSEALPSLGHSYQLEETKATCSDSGKKVYTCSRCDAIYSETVPALGHDYKLQDVKNPSCTEDGQADYLCARCLHPESETLPMLGHDMRLSEKIAVSCEENGYDLYRCSRCVESEIRNEVSALGHSFIFPEGDYFRLVKCDRENCTVCARRDSENNYADVFAYTFSEERKGEIEAIYSGMIGHLESLAKYDESRDAYVAGSQKEADCKAFIETWFSPFEDAVMELDIQYSVCDLNYYLVNGADGWDEAFSDISAFSTDIGSRYSAVFKTIYDTEYREYFFSTANGWTEAQIAEVLENAEKNGNPRFAELQALSDKILLASREEGADIPALYLQFIDVQNEIAGIFGYDNYMEYAYREVYNREYSPSDVASMRKFVKEYFGGTAFLEVELAYELLSDELDDDAAAILASISDGAVISDAYSCNLIGDYYEYLGEIFEGSSVNCYEILNDAFRNGVVFSGEFEAAFTNDFLGLDLPYVYFGPGSYSSAFTFVHEFGHFIGFDRLKTFGLSYDFAETQSQGDEMLFLAYLGQCLSDLGYEDVFRTLLYSCFSDSLAAILLCTCVDEFEQVVYTGKYDGENPTVLAILDDQTIEADELQPLFTALLAEYDASGFLNQEYWSYVVIESPGYYISYAMSWIPAMMICLDAETDFEVGASEYLKLFSFKDDEDYYDAEECKILVEYRDILAYAGIGSAFDEASYLSLAGYIADSVEPMREMIDFYLRLFGLESTLVAG